MTSLLLLLALSLKRARILLMAMGFLLVALQLLLVLIAGSIERAGEFEQLASLLPPFVRALLGPSLVSVMSFSGLACLGFFDLGVVIALLALTIALATVHASDVETGFADLILARPLQRHWLITRTIALVLVAILMMMTLMVAGTWAGLAMLAPENVTLAISAHARLARPESGSPHAVLGRCCDGFRRGLPPHGRERDNGSARSGRTPA